MDFHKRDTSQMDERELRLYKMSARQAVTTKKEELKKMQMQLEKGEMDKRYLIKQREQLEMDVDEKKGKMRVADNNIAQLSKELEEAQDMKKKLNEEVLLNERQVSGLDLQMKNKDKELENLSYEIRSMGMDIKKLENDFREI